ncbi:uncharacterized protein TM35_000091520 [Trypanosoma theileri]|uniref:Uncharacterized protein n=1 Tax=Trypanosoma theileri TaxID=67003 RepID=A0A1X0NZJ3_9TRYP|nr:uncharacterized protein TM35_000091520 [Trypanosoma theileri]ORC90102.1 hypothetical protein TM35_000091520 [Trypanosoma theileri]
MTGTTCKERNAAAVQRLFLRGQTSSRPQFMTPNARLYDGTLPPEMHLSNQWQLAHEVNGTAVQQFNSGTITPSSRHIDYGDPSSSCYSMRRMIARHAWESHEGAKEKLQGLGPNNSSSNTQLKKRERKAAIAREEAIIRYELSIPRRRVVGHLSQLTEAQGDLVRNIPTTQAADKLVARYGGRWVLQNPHRQQLLHGEPVMTRIMHGEFYCPQQKKVKTPNFCQANKRHVRIASDINYILHQREIN